MQNKPMYEWLSELSKGKAFRETLGLSDRLLDERYEVELALRFVLLKTMSDPELKEIKDLDLARFLTNKMIAAAESNTLDYQREFLIFERTFELLNLALEDDSFKKYDSNKQKFIGGFSVSGFEAVALGIGYQLSQDVTWDASYNLAERVKSLWNQPEFKDNMGSGVSSSSRIPKIVPFSRTFFR
jgi:hypothetical protein